MSLRTTGPIVAALLALACSGAAASPAVVDSLRGALAGLPPDTTRVMALQRLSLELYNAHSDSALAPAVEAERIARRLNFWRGIMHSLYAQGLAHWGASRYDEALRHYRQALNLAVPLKADHLRFRLLNNMGVVYNVSGRPAEAMQAYQECLELAPLVGAGRHLPLILLNIGNIYAYLEDHQTAYDYFRRGAERCSTEDPSLLASLCTNLSSMCVQLGRRVEAVAYGRRSLELRAGLGDPLLLAGGRMTLADAMQATGRADTALVLVEAALPLLRNQPDRERLANALVSYGVILGDLGRTTEARDVLGEALDLSVASGAVRSERRAHFRLRAVEERLGNTEAALDHARRYITLADSLSTPAMVRRMAAIEERFQARYRMSVLENSRRSTRRIALVGGIAALIVALVLVRLYVVQKRLNATLHVRADELEQKVEERTEELRSLSQHLVRLREQERRRIARDIHDDLSQSLTAIRLHLSHLGSRNRDADLVPALERTTEIATTALRESTRLIRDLRPVALDELGLQGALTWLADRHRTRTGAQVNVELPDHDACSEDVTLALFRIAQEAFQNIYKHAAATEVALSLAVGDGRVTMAVRDNGRGLGDGAASGRSFGLMGMQESARSIGGTLTIESGPDAGTAIRIDAPC